MNQNDDLPFRPLTVKPRWLNALCLLAAAMTLHLPVYAQDLPAITPSLQKLLHGLPLAELEGELHGLLGDLKTTSCGSNLTGCYMSKSGPLQLYFFTSGQAQQTLLLVVDKSLPMPKLLGGKVQNVMGATSIEAPIFSLSTTDYQLDTSKMPAVLQQVVQQHYFNVNTLSFASGVQLAARTNLDGPIKLAMSAMGVNASQLTMRAAVVMPMPSDLTGGAGAGVAVADAIAHGNTMTAAAADAMKPEAFVEFQFAPNASLVFGMPQMTLTDATFFLNNELIFGYKGNAAYKGAESKKVIMDFKTPLDPAGAMDLLDFTFRMATPASFTMEDAAHVMVAMATRDPRLVKYGGGFIRNIESFKDPLLTMTKPLSVIQLRNPIPPAEYRFGDSSKPFPADEKYFNLAILGPLADGGPLLNVAGDVTILGQKMGWLAASAGTEGLRGDVGAALTLKLGPLGRINVKLEANTAINAARQELSLLGNVAGQKVAVGLSGSTMTVEVSASCVNPFEIKTQVAITPTTNIADVFEGQGGVNVDPAKISGCIGKELEAAYHKIAGEFSHLEGYTASAASDELNKIGNEAAAEATRLADATAKAAKDEYNRVKAQTRKAAENSINAAKKMYSGASNAVLSAAGGHTAHIDTTYTKTFMYDRSLFDWDYFYDANPKLVAAKTDLVAYWESTGYLANMRGSLEFDSVYYRSKNPDVMVFSSFPAIMLMMHWLDHGIREGRQSSPDFDIKSYVNRYPDVKAAFGTDYARALVHWLDIGKPAGRDARPSK